MEEPPAIIQEHERGLRTVFDLGLLFKAVTGAIEVAGAFVVAFVPRVLIARIADIVTEGELNNDPDDTVANTIRSLAHEYAIHAHYLLTSFLLIEGIIKIIVVVLVFRGKRYAYPIFIVAMGILGSYEAYRGITTHNYLLVALAVLDVVLIELASHEYKRRYFYHSS